MGPKHSRARWCIEECLLDAVSTFTELEARISRLPTDLARGDAFEILGAPHRDGAPPEPAQPDHRPRFVVLPGGH